MLYLLSLVITLCIITALFLNLNPNFGGNPTKEEKESYKHLDNYKNGKFINEVPIKNSMSIRNLFSMIKDSFTVAKGRNPDSKIPVDLIEKNKIDSEKDSFTWLGHSTFLASINNKKLLLDPMLGDIASPVSFAGSRRYKYSENILDGIENISTIDAVFISHDHYDHLDYKTIIKLKDKVSNFFVPLGVSSHLIRWGVKKERITTFNWWDEIEWEGLTISLVPSRHFSGRGPFNSNTTLWGGWAILGKDTRLYTSGDGGYGPHFKKIGDKYGPFDITLIEGAQYDRRWLNFHMMPEESVQANLDVKGKKMMLMHWSAFTLAFHGWDEPIKRAQKEAKKLNVNLVTPKIGETVILDIE